MTAVVSSSSYSPAERRSVFWSCVLGFGLDFYNIAILAFLINPIRSTLGLSLSEAAAVVTATLIGSVVGGVAFGWVGDRLGRKVALQATLALFSAGAILSAMAWDWYALLAFRFITGIGLGGEWGAGMVLFNEVWASRRRGLGSAIVQASAAGGTALAAIVSAVALTYLPVETAWRLALAIGASPLLLMIYVRKHMPESREWASVAGNKEQVSGQSILSPDLLRVTLVGLLLVFGYTSAFFGLSTFVPGLMASLGAEANTVGIITLVGAFITGAVMIGVGWAADRWGPRLAAFVPTLLMAAMGGAIALTADQRFEGSILNWPLAWAYVLWSIGGAGVAVFGLWLSMLYPTSLRSTGVSSVYMVGRGIGAFSPVLVGLIGDMTGDGTYPAIVVATAGTLVCLISILLLPTSSSLPSAQAGSTSPEFSKGGGA